MRVGESKASGHPPADIFPVENFAVNIVNPLMAGPKWSSTLVILIWDEWGNRYEHTIPPSVERLADGKPFRYGHCVPWLVISSYPRAGTVGHECYLHVSTLRTIEAIFDLSPLNDRDGQANSLLDCFDFTQPPLDPLPLRVRTCNS
jgi:phospholipase C